MSYDTMNIVWRCADSPAPVPMLTGDDVAMLPPRDFERLRDMGLLRPGDTVGHVICRDCGDDHLAEVMRIVYPDGTVRFFAVCPKNGRVEIPRERLLQWTMDFTPLLAAIMSALGSSEKPQEVVPGRVWNLGRAALVGQSRPLWAVRGLSWPDAAAIAQAVPKGRSPVVFVLGQLPDGEILDIPSDSLIEARTVSDLDAKGLSVSTAAIDSQLRGNPPEPVAKKAKKRGQRTAAIDAIKQALREHLRAARDHAYSSRDHDEGPNLLPRPSQQQLADQLKVHVSSVSRAINDPSDKEIAILWEAANDIEKVMKFKS